MIKGSRVLIINENKDVLLIHRLKYDQEYYVLPGGTIEEGESPEEAAVREIKEETNLNVELKSLLWEIEEDVNGELRYGYFFQAKNFEGELKLGGPEAEIDSEKNKYILEWVSLEKLKGIKFYPQKLKDEIILKCQ